MRVRTISYFLSITAIAAIFFTVEFVTEKYLYPNDEVVDILAAIIGALSFAPCKRFFDCATDAIFSRGERDLHAEFITNISHELQTPIAILRGNVELLQRKNIAEAERERAERVIVATLDGMSRMIGNVLEGAKLKFSKKILNKTPVALDVLLLEICEDCQLLAEDRGIRLSLDRDINSKSDGMDTMIVYADRDRLREVFLNLISNALKHTPRGGAIVLRTERATAAALVTVEDSGRGIAPDALPHIFERFYRIAHHPIAFADGDSSAASVQPVEPSHGIGLNICQEIVEAHGGKIVAESDVGKGSRFIVSLPLAAPPSVGQAVHPSASPPQDISAIINS